MRPAKRPQVVTEGPLLGDATCIDAEMLRNETAYLVSDRHVASRRHHRFAQHGRLGQASALQQHAEFPTSRRRPERVQGIGL